MKGLRSIGRRVRTFGSRIGSAFPAGLKPSKATALTALSAGIIELVAIPIPNGTGGYDSWIGRLRSGYEQYQSSKNPFDLIAEDSAGNNALSIAALQLQQNFGSAVWTWVGGGIAAAFLRWTGM